MALVGEPSVEIVREGLRDSDDLMTKGIRRWEQVLRKLRHSVLARQPESFVSYVTLQHESEA